MVAAVAGLGAPAAAGGWGIPIGTPVHDARGEEVDTVVKADPYALVVARGRFLVRDCPVSLSDVDRFKAGKIYVKLTKDEALGVGRDGRGQPPGKQNADKLGACALTPSAFRLPTFERV